MHAAKLISNATVIGVLNLAAFLIGFLIFSISASGEQRLVQGTAALVVGIALVVGWLVLFRKFNHLKVEFDFIKVFLLAFPFTAIVFVPIHFLFTGYLTGIGNILAVGAYQFPMNALALAISAAIIQRKEKAPRGGLPSATG